MKNKLNDMRTNILQMVEEFAIEKYSLKKFIPGESHIPVSGKVLTSLELKYMTDAVLDGWLTTGEFNRQFENDLSIILGTKYVLTTNSGSSANLLAVSALTSPLLKERRLLPGDEVITVAAGFPTTINPIIQNNLIPVFVDMDIQYLNINIDLIDFEIILYFL